MDEWEWSDDPRANGTWSDKDERWGWTTRTGIGERPIADRSFLVFGNEYLYDMFGRRSKVES